MEIIVAIFAVVIGIPSRIIDRKHRKMNAYEPGNAWEYYSTLGKAGSWEGKFMIWTTVLGFYLILGVLGHTFYALAR